MFTSNIKKCKYEKETKNFRPPPPQVSGLLKELHDGSTKDLLMKHNGMIYTIFGRSCCESCTFGLERTLPACVSFSKSKGPYLYKRLTISYPYKYTVDNTRSTCFLFREQQNIEGIMKYDLFTSLICTRGVCDIFLNMFTFRESWTFVRVHKMLYKKIPRILRKIEWNGKCICRFFPNVITLKIVGYFRKRVRVTRGQFPKLQIVEFDDNAQQILSIYIDPRIELQELKIHDLNPCRHKWNWNSLKRISINQQFWLDALIVHAPSPFYQLEDLNVSHCDMKLYWDKLMKFAPNLQKFTSAFTRLPPICSVPKLTVIQIESWRTKSNTLLLKHPIELESINADTIFLDCPEGLHFPNLKDFQLVSSQENINTWIERLSFMPNLKRLILYSEQLIPCITLQLRYAPLVTECTITNLNIEIDSHFNLKEFTCFYPRHARIANCPMLQKLNLYMFDSRNISVESCNNLKQLCITQEDNYKPSKIVLNLNWENLEQLYWPIMENCSPYFSVHGTIEIIKKCTQLKQVEYQLVEEQHRKTAIRFLINALPNGQPCVFKDKHGSSFTSRDIQRYLNDWNCWK